MGRCWLAYAGPGGICGGTGSSTFGAGMLMSGCGGGGSFCGTSGFSGFSIPGNPGTVGGSDGGTMIGGSNSGTTSLNAKVERLEGFCIRTFFRDMVTTFHGDVLSFSGYDRLLMFD
jgi:hypothetical protein